MSKFFDSVDRVMSKRNTVETLCLAVGALATIKGLVDFEMVHPFLGLAEMAMGGGTVAAATYSKPEQAS